mgnify:CR=1 FL=1
MIEHGPLLERLLAGDFVCAVSDDNAYVEALMRTLKYRPEYPPTPFDSLEQAREWMTGLLALVQPRTSAQCHSVRYS